VFLRVHLDFRLGAKRAQQHALHVAFFGLGRGKNASPHLLGDERMIPRKLQQAASAEQIGTAVSDVRDAEIRAVDPGSRQSCTHAMLFRMLFGGLEDSPVGEVKGRRKALCPGAPVGLCWTHDARCGIGFDIQAVFYNGFNGHGAGDFAVRLSTHAVREHEKV